MLLNRSIRVAAIVAFCSCVLTAQGQRPAAWTYGSSSHFEVYTTGGEARAREALLYFERAHAFFRSYLKLTPVQTRPTRLIVFSNDKEYAPYRPNEFATAYYQSGPDGDTIVMRSLEPSSLTVVVHEYVHLLVRHSGERFPVWLNEGLAEYFSTLAPEAGRMSIGRVPIGRLQHLSNGSSGLMPLEKLFGVTHDSPEYTTKTHAGTFYSQSWALTHMLMSDPRYNPKSSQLLAAIAGGAKGAAALESVYQRSTDVVFKDLQAYIRQDRYRYSLVDYKAPAEEAKSPTRAAAAFEAGLVTANLLAGGRASEGEARAAFEALAKEKPDDLGLLEARGYFELRRSGPADAAPYFARAVDRGTKNASLLRDYAIILLKEPEKAEALLTKALSLAPGDIDTRIRLANVFLLRRKTDEALATLSTVTQVPPDSAVNFFGVLATAAANAGQLDEARRAATRAIEAARTDTEKRSTAQLAASIQEFADRRAEVDRANRERMAAAATRTTTVIRDPNAPPPAPERPAPKVTVSGRITNFDCNTPGVLQVTTATGTLRLLIENLRTVPVQGSGSERPDLVCGPQNASARIGYDPATNATLKTAGIVKLLDFRK